jgi:hypothetical protein
MLLSNYITVDDVREYGYQIDDEEYPDGRPTDVALVGKIIPRAARIFDVVAEVEPGYFGAFAAPAGAPDGGAVVQYFYGDGSAILRLPPYIGPLADGDVTLPEGYTVPQYYERADRWGNRFLQAAPSAQAVSLVDADAWFGGSLRSVGWACGVQIGVKAKWGFAATPEDVKEACIELVISIRAGKDPAFAKVVRVDDKETIYQALPDRTKLIACKYAERVAPEVAI